MNITEAIKLIIQENVFLHGAFLNKLLNIEATAKYIHKMVEVKTEKSHEVGSISNAIRKLQKKINIADELNDLDQNLFVDNITINSPLISFTYDFSQELLLQAIKATSAVQKDNGKVCLIHGMNEFSLLFNSKNERIITFHISTTPKNEKRNLAACIINYREKCYDTPGVIYKISLYLTLQGISIYEISNTYTELIIYVDRDKADSVNRILLKYFKSYD